MTPARLRRLITGGLRILLRRPIASARVIPVLPDGRIVLVLNRDTGKWSVPGGVIEWGEGVKSAGARELAEETGLEMAGVRRLVGVYGDPDPDVFYHDVSIVIAANAAGTIHDPDPDEIRAVRAFSRADVPMRQVQAGQRRHIEDYFAERTTVS